MIATAKFIAAASGLLMYAGAGCFAPTVVSEDAEQVVLKAGPWDTEGELQGRADQLCGRHGKAARRDDGIDLAALEGGFVEVRFACVSQSRQAQSR